MASKFCSQAVFDAALAKIATATHMIACSNNPTSNLYANIAAVALTAAATMTVGLGNGDYTAAAGDTNGRKVTISQKTGVSVTSSGTATCVVLDDGSTLLYATTCTSQALTSGNTVTFNSWKIEIADPT